MTQQPAASGASPHDKDAMEARRRKLAGSNFWDEIFQLRDEQRSQRRKGLQVIKRAGLPSEENRQGLMRWYLHPKITDTALSTLMFFEQELPPGGRSGRVKFQGGQVMFIVEGSGYTLIDGVRYNWNARDLLNLPLKPDGIIVQHFNASDTQRARFVATEPNWFACTSVDRGCGFEQLEDAPKYSAPKQG